jgi:hypothetical protein
MARKRTHKGNKTPKTVQAKGAAWTEQDASTAILLERFNQFDIVLRQMQAQMAALATAQDTQQQQYLAELAEQKAASAEALTAAREALQKLHETKPPDPKTTKAIMAYEAEQADKRIKEKRAKFKAALRDSVKGEIVNPTDQAIQLGLNGLYVIIKPGVNTKVPGPFIKEWERRITLSKWAEEQDRLAQGQKDFGELQAWRARNTLEQAGPKDFTIWGEGAGASVGSQQEVLATKVETMDVADVVSGKNTDVNVISFEVE